jgi:hypothetical protein
MADANTSPPESREAYVEKLRDFLKQISEISREVERLRAEIEHVVAREQREPPH